MVQGREIALKGAAVPKTKLILNLATVAKKSQKKKTQQQPLKEAQEGRKK